MNMIPMENKTKSGGNILASVIPLSVLFVLIQAASLIGFFYVSFRAVEKYAIEKNLQSCVNVMQTELDRISGVVYEWSAWDATVQFVKGENSNYIKNNTAENTFEEQKLNVFCILDAQGKPVWTHCVKFHDDKQEIVKLTLFTPEVLEQNPALWKHKDPNSCVTGYFSTEGGALMLCSRPVVSSNQPGIIHGAVIMGRFVSDNFIASITQQECQAFDWWNLRTEYTKNAMQQYLARITDENPVYVETTPDTATAYTVLPDIDGNDAILIKFVMANDVASFKQGWLARCLGIYAIEGLIFIVYLAAFANKHCTKCRAQIIQDEQFTAQTQYVSIQQIPETQRSEEELLI
jgi:sensor domain CHASE-containing protein